MVQELDEVIIGTAPLTSTLPVEGGICDSGLCRCCAICVRASDVRVSTLYPLVFLKKMCHTRAKFDLIQLNFMCVKYG